MIRQRPERSRRYVQTRTSTIALKRAKLYRQALGREFERQHAAALAAQHPNEWPPPGRPN